MAHMSWVMRKPAFCICENKGEDQVTTQLISAFAFATYIHVVQLLYFLIPKIQAPNHLLWPIYTARFMSDPVGNTKDRFDHDEAHIVLLYHIVHVSK